MHSEYPNLAIGILFALLGVQCFGVVYLFKLYRREVLFFRVAEATEGLVVGSWHYANGDGPSYFAKVLYRVGTTEYVLKGGLWTSSRRKRGEKLRVRYLPQAPGDGRVERKWETRFFLVGAIILLGPISLIVALLAKELLQ